jgi:hypothetical protein
VATLTHDSHQLVSAMRKVRIAVLAAIVIAAPAATAAAQSGASEPERAFLTATRDYAQMHRRLERQIGPIEISTPIPLINQRIEQLAAAIRAERAYAKQGDLFTPAVAHEIRVRIDAALRARDLAPADVVAASLVEGVDYVRTALRVNGTFPWILGAAMLPCLIEALPPLPPELQYRIVDRDLVLIDVHASLIVDILPAALGWDTER